MDRVSALLLSGLVGSASTPALAQEAVPVEVTTERVEQGRRAGDVLALCGSFGLGGGVDSLDRATREVQTWNNGFVAVDGDLCLGARVTPWLLLSAGATAELQGNDAGGLGFGRLGPELGLQTPWVALTVTPPFLSTSSNPRDGNGSSFFDGLPAEAASLKVYPGAFANQDSVLAHLYVGGSLGRVDPYGPGPKDYHHPAFAFAGGEIGISGDFSIADLLKREAKVKEEKPEETGEPEVAEEVPSGPAFEIVVRETSFDFKNKELPLPEKRELTSADVAFLIQQKEEAKQYASSNRWGSAKTIHNALKGQVPNYPYDLEIYRFFAEAAQNLGQIDEWYQWLKVVQAVRDDEKVQSDLNNLASGFGYVSIDFSDLTPFTIAPEVSPFAPEQRASNLGPSNANDGTLSKIADDGEFKGFLTAGTYTVTFGDGQTLLFTVNPFNLANPMTQEITLNRNKAAKK